MPAGPIIDGNEVLAGGTYVVRSVEDALSLPGGAGNIVLVGEFPVLEKDRVYRFTSRSTLERAVAPEDADLKLMAKLVYEASKPSSPKAPPASVSLVNVTPVTQATGYVPTQQLDAEKPLIKSKIWGPRGNTTVVRFAPRPTVGGVRVDVSNMGRSQPVTVPGIPNAVTVSNTNPIATVPPPNAYGFGTRGGGTCTLELSNNPDTTGVAINFVRQLPGALVNAVGASWTPLGPIKGTLSFRVLLGSAIVTATTLQATITGTDADGLPATEVLTNTPDDVPNGQWDVNVTVNGTTVWSSVDTIDINTNVAGTFTGNVQIFGYNYKSEAADISVAELIAELNNLGGGFVAATGYGNTSAIPQAKLDVSSAQLLPASLSAQGWSLEKTINEQSSYITIDMEGRTYTPVVVPYNSATTYAEDDLVEYDNVWYQSLQNGNTDNDPATEDAWWVAITGLTTVLTGGTKAAAVTQANWQTAHDELLYHQVQGIVPLTNDIGILTDVHLPHLRSAWGEYQVPRTSFIGVTGNLSYESLQNTAALLDNEKVQRCFDLPTVVMPNGSTKELPTWALAVMMASAANSKRGDTLDRWEPNVVSLRRNAALAGPSFNNDIIRLGYSVFFGFAQTNAKLLLECTGWITDNNALRTQAGALRSSVDVHQFVKDGLDAAIAVAGSIDGLRGALEGVLDTLLDTLKNAGVIVDYREINIQEYTTFFNAKFKYMPRGTKSYIVVDAQASFAAFVNAA